MLIFFSEEECVESVSKLLTLCTIRRVWGGCREFGTAYEGSLGQFVKRVWGGLWREFGVAYEGSLVWGQIGSAIEKDSSR